MQLPRDLTQMNAQELRDLAAALVTQVTEKDQELKFKQLKIDQLTHEMAILKRWRFGRRSEQLDPAQRSLLEESIDEDLEAIGLELEALRGKPKREQPKDQPRRTALPAHLPRREIRHDPEHRVCSCGCTLVAAANRPQHRLQGSSVDRCRLCWGGSLRREYWGTNELPQPPG